MDLREENFGGNNVDGIASEWYSKALWRVLSVVL